jgi:SWIM zinc finger
MFTQAAAKRILNAQRITKITVLPHVVVVVFQMLGVAGYCCKFVSKKSFAADAAAQREQAAANVSTIASDERYALVQGSKGDLYTVDTLEQTCTCPDHTYHQVTCKHLIRAMAEMAGRVVVAA